LRPQPTITPVHPESAGSSESNSRFPAMEEKERTTSETAEVVNVKC
jgi:hypothetical protein